MRAPASVPQACSVLLYIRVLMGRGRLSHPPAKRRPPPTCPRYSPRHDRNAHAARVVIHSEMTYTAEIIPAETNGLFYVKTSWDWEVYGPFNLERATSYREDLLVSVDRTRV